MPRILTDDTALNRAVSAAAVRAEQILLREEIMDSLREIRLALMSLSGVRRDVAPDFSAARHSLAVGANEHERLLSLAELLVQGVPALPMSERQEPNHPMSAWINIETLFEEAVRSIAQAALGGQGTARVGRGDGTTLFQYHPDDPITPKKNADPDVVIRHETGVLLLDAKYRRHERQYTEEELYQLMAHARAYNARAAALVAPSRNKSDPSKQWIGRDRGGIAYYIISVDPSSVDGMIAPIANWISRQITLPPKTFPSAVA
jgi:5-methylcytosine-specific restriction endonuclease McrBC regulatory subunit McrC